MINILTDSTADIPRALIENFHIEAIPMYIQLNGKVYKDGEEIDAKMLFDIVSETGIYPTTSAPSPRDFFEFFNREEPSIYIGVSSKLSMAFRNALLAQRELGNERLELIDSLSFSTGYGQVVLQAAEWRDSGMDFHTLSDKIRSMIEKTRGIFILDTLDYIYHGGRCSSIEHFVSSLLRIHPFLNVLPDGTLGILQKVPGSRIRAVKTLLDYLINQLKTIKVNRVFITHLDCEEEAVYLHDQISSLFPSIELFTVEIGCALASHSGPKPLGIAYSFG